MFCQNAWHTSCSFSGPWCMQFSGLLPLWVRYLISGTTSRDQIYEKLRNRMKDWVKLRERERRLGTVKERGSAIWTESKKAEKLGTRAGDRLATVELWDVLFSETRWSGSFAGFDNSLCWYIYGNRRWRPRPNLLHLPATVLLCKHNYFPLSLHQAASLPALLTDGERHHKYFFF